MMTIRAVVLLLPLLLLDRISAVTSSEIQFDQPLQRFLYDHSTDTIILAAVNHVYSINASDLAILADVTLAPAENDNHCLLTNKTSVSPNSYHFSSASHLPPSFNSTFNQLLLLVNQSVLICSTSNRGGACQLRSVIDLRLLKNSSQRIVSSSPAYPSIGFVSEHTRILYLANTYDLLCDPFYEIPTITGRLLNDDFLSIINFNAGQSALQQSANTLRLLNTRLVKDFFLSYVYGFEHANISYFLTIQQSDVSHGRTSRLQTKIVRFCQSAKQSLIKSYVEMPITCGQHYPYLVTGKFVKENQVFYGIFRNTTLANGSNTAHAVCAYSMASIREAFFQTIKHCIVDGKGYRGLSFISPDTHCVSNKNVNEINQDYCPDNDDSFVQYPIGGHRSLEQIEPIIELTHKVNVTAIEIVPTAKDVLVFLGDDHGTVHTFQTSKRDQVSTQTFPSSMIIDLKLINHQQSLRNANLLVLTNRQIIKQKLSTCEQYSTCDQCSQVSTCHWCTREKRCAPAFECVEENYPRSASSAIDTCTGIEQITPDTLALPSADAQLEIVLNTPLRNERDEYQCRFRLDNDEAHLESTSAVLLNKRTLKCLPPALPHLHKPVHQVAVSLHHLGSNRTFGYVKLTLVNCSNFLSCSSCTSYANQCVWNLQAVSCFSHDNKNSVVAQRKRFVTNAEQCPSIYLRHSVNRLAFNTDRSLAVHFEQCYDGLNVQSCRLTDYRKRFIFPSSNATVVPSTDESHLCFIHCSFELKGSDTVPQPAFHRPLHLDLSLQLPNDTAMTIPRSHIALYQCERLALNCTSCLQLDASFGCIWCNNACMLKNQTVRDRLVCPHSQECLVPVVDDVEPLLLPMNGGTLVTIKGKNFDLFNLTIQLVDVPCALIEEESSTDKIVCQAGDAGASARNGPVTLQFGTHGPQVQSRQIVSYIYPSVTSIEPLLGIESGGTLLTIVGENLTLGNSHIAVIIGNRPCQLLSISRTKIQCETSAFSPLMLNEQQPIMLLFDRQTKVESGRFFTAMANPILYSFDGFHQFQSFVSGGHQLLIHGENLHTVQNIRLEFKRVIFVTPLSANRTHLVFLTPSIQELHLNDDDNDYQQEIEIILHLDHLNRTSSVVYLNDPLVYELEPMLQAYTNQLTIQGANLTAVGHTKEDISVNIGCDPCVISQVQADRIVCQPPLYRPKKYGKNNRLCYDSEHPWIIVTIDNIHSHVGYMIYPKKIVILGIISGCLLTMLTVVLIILLIVCVRVRCSQRKTRRRYLYGAGIDPHENGKEAYKDNLLHKSYQKLPILEPCAPDGSVLTAVPLRSYVNYLQLCYFYYFNDAATANPPYDTPKAAIKHDSIEQLGFLLGNNGSLLEYLYKLLVKSRNKKLLSSLVLTQRYHLNALLQLNNDPTYFNICMLTAFDGLLSNQITTLIFQLYYQLKHKICSGPIDALEQTCSYYSLNNHTILHDQSILFNPIQLTVHVEFANQPHDFLALSVTCLSCDSISQAKQKMLHQLASYRKLQSPSIHDSQLYLLTNTKSCSTSSCSSSTTSSSNVPLAKKSMLTQFFSNHKNKYSTTTTTTSSDSSYRDAIVLQLHDIDNTNEQINHCRKLNTLQHYGIVSDGYELKLVLSNRTKSTNYATQSNHTLNSKRTLHRNTLDCQYCASELEKPFSYLTSLPTSSPATDIDRAHYFHLLNHTYEEIGEAGHLLMANNQSETYRLFETKSTIHSTLINLIETLFTNFLHSDIYLSELIEQHSRFLHIFYGHFVPFLLQHLNCLFDLSMEPCVNSSFEILATIFHVACSSPASEQHCLLCAEPVNNLNVQNCTLLFADEIQRVRLHYSNIERRLNNKNSTSEYSTTNTGITRTFELDASVIQNLIEYLCLHVDEVTEFLRTQSTDNKSLIIFFNLVQTYRSNGRS